MCKSVKITKKTSRNTLYYVINSSEHNKVTEITTAKTQCHHLYRFPFVIVKYPASSV